MWGPEGEEKERRAESLCRELMAENFPYVGKDMDIHFHEASKDPKQDQPKEDYPETYYNQNAKIHK